VFGTIDSAGLMVLDEIAATGVTAGGDDGKPAKDVTIKSAKLG
jgi:peptidyl-prolyl cis-trans isomerase B (cyclophilin B)